MFSNAAQVLKLLDKYSVTLVNCRKRTGVYNNITFKFYCNEYVLMGKVGTGCKKLLLTAFNSELQLMLWTRMLQDLASHIYVYRLMLYIFLYGTLICCFQQFRFLDLT